MGELDSGKDTLWEPEDLKTGGSQVADYRTSAPLTLFLDVENGIVEISASDR